MAAEGELGVAAAHERDELLVHDLHDLLRRREALHDLGAERALLDVRDELAHDLEVDVGLEQRQADLAHGGVDVLGGELAVALEALHDPLEAVGECVEHQRPWSCGGRSMVARRLWPAAARQPAGRRETSTQRSCGRPAHSTGRSIAMPSFAATRRERTLSGRSAHRRAGRGRPMQRRHVPPPSRIRAPTRHAPGAQPISTTCSSSMTRATSPQSPISRPPARSRDRVEAHTGRRYPLAGALHASRARSSVKGAGSHQITSGSANAPRPRARRSRVELADDEPSVRDGQGSTRPTRRRVTRRRCRRRTRSPRRSRRWRARRCPARTAAGPRAARRRR